ncbi:MAG: hypothetical protein DRG59_02560 [Deltaproteobacteria bacterium]|nr:MAG: hypothetical protein DRG59_02560 [Deltaproteobacteria bacterium]
MANKTKLKWTLVFLVIPLLLFLKIPDSPGSECPGDLGDRADVTSNPSGNDYDVYFTDNDTTSSDYCERFRAEWVRDAVLNAHNVYVSTTHNFKNPYFSVSPNDICIYDSANIGTAGKNRITLDAPSISSATEPWLRTIVSHELFHHVQFHYIDFNQWPSWGAWTVEGTARSMEDKIYLDNDNNPANALYFGQVNNYLGDPNRTLMDISYSAALFWTYLCEQLGTPFPEPARGVDVIQRFWANTDGNSPDSMKYIRETINSFSSGTTFEEMFRDFCIANYTHDLDVSALSDPDKYRYYDETAAGGGTSYDSVARTSVGSWNTTHSDQVVRWGARYFEINVPSEKRCEAIGFWGKSKSGETLSWAIIGLQGDRVLDIYRSSGGTFYRALINPPRSLYDKLAVVVVGLNKGSDFDYAFGWGAVSGEIRRPIMSRMAYVGEKDDPERFQARLRLLGPSVLTPPGTGSISIKGLDPTDFTVVLESSSTGAEYVASIINASYVSGEYWLVIQAPEITNAADGDLYDLKICFCADDGSCASSMNSPKSVLYTKVTRNQMMVLDRSYSMHYPTGDSKINAAKTAAKFYVESASDDDRLGLVTFNGNNSECDHDAVIDYALTDVLGHRNNLISKIRSVTESGWTSIGDGLKDGRNEVMSATSSADIHSIVLLSDGMENEGDYWALNNPSCSTPPVKNSFDPTSGWASGVRIDTVAFGPTTNQEIMQNIAAFTEGDYYYVSFDPPSTSALAMAPEDGNGLAAAPVSSSLEVPNRLANVYRSIEEEVYGQDRLFYTAVRVSAGSPVSVKIPVTEKAGGGIRDAVFGFNWQADVGAVNIKLYDPDGILVVASSTWKIFSCETNKVYHYGKILPTGEWEAVIQPSKNIQLLCTLSGKIVRGVDIDIKFSQVPAHEKCDPRPVSTYLRGLPITILVNLNDSRGGISGPNMVAEISNPEGTSNRLVLFDDGDHEDGLPGDGIYGNSYTRTPFFSNGGGADFPARPPSGKVGSYTVSVTARGQSNYGEEFERYATGSFHVYDYVGQECDPDKDKDGLPDRWENLVGLDDTDPSDIGDDNDNDGLNNKDEFHYGTHPFNADTDSGGESDGSEVMNGRDPLYQRDDLLPAIIDYGIITQRIDIPVHEPRPNTNILHFPVNPTYQYMQVWRTDPTWSGFRRVANIDLKSDPSGVYYDGNLKNGQTYRYYLVSEGLSGATTAPTSIFTGTPKSDPLSSKGWVTINHNASRTDSPNVYLQLDTSDDSKLVKASCDPTLAGASSQPMSSEIPFTLVPTGPEPCLVTVYVKFLDQGGNQSIVYTASIILDQGGDFDGDGIINSIDPDDDDDGLKDSLEITIPGVFPFGYDPFNPDTDGDGIKDGDEDPDRDKLTNLYELKYGTDPAHNLADINNDNKFNAFDINYFRNYFMSHDSRADVNGDGKVDARDINAFRNAYMNELKYHNN